MKTKIAIVGLVFAAIGVYLYKRSKRQPEALPVKRSHHLTEAFSKAKKVAISS